MTDAMDEVDRALNERQWLVRLCARLTGTPGAAEDLAQETLLEAWRHAHKLTDLAGRERWLAGIARNVCRRWRRSHWQTVSRLAPSEPDEALPSTHEIAAELEQRDLRALLERALWQLPPPTRQALVARYLHDLPYRTIAERLGVSEDAVSMRLSRGRLHLRRLLTTQLAEGIASYAPAVVAGDGWEETALWCRTCGQHRLRARLPHTAGTIAFRCPGCKPDPATPDTVFPLTNRYFAHLLGRLRRPSVILGRGATWAHGYFLQALSCGAALCTHCGGPVDLRIAEGDGPAPTDACPPFLAAACPSCGAVVSTSFHGIVLNLPEVHAFWEAETRIRRLPDYAVEVAGQAAVVTPFESVASAARLDVITPLDPRLLARYRVVQSGRSA